MIKAIETKYKGYRFRSRLEARWAVFFDAMGWTWGYEVEGFVLPDGTRYLPDFKVTCANGVVTWYEVKPEGHGPDEKMMKFAAALSAPSGEHVRSGVRVYHVTCGRGEVIRTEGSGHHFRAEVAFDRGGTRWFVVAYANFQILSSPDIEERFKTVCGDPLLNLPNKSSPDYREQHEAAVLARSARFEHGETPQLNKAA